MNDNNNIISLSKACEKLSISEATGRNWIKSGLLLPIESSEGIYFESDHIDKINEGINSNKIDRLNRRRNKKRVEGSYIPKKYIDSMEGMELVENILSSLPEEFDEDLIYLIIAEYSLKFYHKTVLRNNENHIFIRDILSLSNNSQVEVINLAASYLKENKISSKDIEYYIEQYSSTFNFDTFSLKNDVLGLLYMSLISTASRKNNGIYYTPTNVVETMVSNLNVNKNNIKVIDPCCGTGNFLIEILKSGIDVSGIYGRDIDMTSVFIARMNIIIFSKSVDKEIINSIVLNIKQQDSLTLIETTQKFDLVVGNPPWGSTFDNSAHEYISKNYKTYSKKGLEAFSLFIELGSFLTKKDGLFSYIVPETFFNVKTHKPIRKLIMENMILLSAIYWGNVFDGVLAPAISFVFKKDVSSDFALGAKITNYKGENHTLKIARNLDSNNWELLITDYELQILNNIENLPNNQYLKNNADFALGIVTGDNKKHLFDKQLNLLYQPIVKGGNVYKYKLSESHLYINYEPDKYQQVARNNLYFAEEKLIYRFISDTLVFAYDNRQTLSLNSANVFVPNIQNFDIKYILAILNSRIAHFYFKLRFNSIKILRNHIESIPIASATELEQKGIIELVNDLINTNDPKDKLDLYNRLDDIIKDIYQLNNEEKEYIDKFYSGNIFL